MGEEFEATTLAGGCFWCTEAVFKRLRGVEKVTAGYSGGDIVNPTYDAVCGGKTGHAECIQIEFDPNIISFETLLEVFFKLHDPTTLNKQGADTGTQYRSAIFYHSDKQNEIAQKVKAKIEKEEVYSDPIVTSIESYKNFYSAEEYHQDYYKRNSYQPYCQIVIDPKIQKLYKQFKNLTVDS